MAYLSATTAAVTGDATNYRPIFNTEGYDVGSWYNASDGKATAPWSGWYLISCTLELSEINDQDYYYWFIDDGSGGVKQTLGIGNVSAMKATSSYANILLLTSSTVMYLSAASVISIRIQSGGGTANKCIKVVGGAGRSNFAAELLSRSV